MISTARVDGRPSEISTARVDGRPSDHKVEHAQQWFRSADVILIAGTVEGDEDLVG
jgi:hypothetical protein